jgi:hypothetical protein
MIRFHHRHSTAFFVCAAGVSLLSINAAAQNSGATFGNNYHVSFERPEAWGLKYFASVTLLSGLPLPEPVEGRRVGSITLGLETAWLPSLDAGQRQIGFDGKAVQDLNKIPVFARPVVRVRLPWKLTAVIAGPPPFSAFGITTHLLAFGLERPLVERRKWVFSWRGYGQLGSIKGAFSCTNQVAGFPPGSAANPTSCLAASSDVSSLRYAGSEFQLAYRIPRMPRLVPHVAAGGNLIDGVFQTNAPVVKGLDRTRLWTRGGTFSATGGVTYLISKRAAFTVDTFYSPLWVNRSATAPRTNDGLFNVRALLSYTIR